MVMGADKKKGNPVTLSQLDERLERFYTDRIEPGLEKRLDRFYHEVVEPGFHRLLIRFYNDVIEPRMDQRIEEKLEEKILPLRQEMRQGFDDLYKKFEDLQQEYTFANVQIKRLNKEVFGKGAS
jgi:hypothetical protein